MVGPESDRSLHQPCRPSSVRLLLPMAVALLITGLWGLSGRAVSSAPVAPTRDQAKISPWVREETAGGARADLLVVLREQADLEPALSLPTKAQRGRWVYETLRQTAEWSQAPLKAWLEARRVRYRPFHIVNLIHVSGADWSLVEALAARPEVARIEANPRAQGADLEAHAPEWGYLAPEGVGWNLVRVNADDVWAMGYTGQDVVIGGQDTGYEWDHPALVGQYREARTGYGRHDYNWHDAIHGNDPHTAAGNPCGFDSLEPCDDDGHGTHTMGIAVGNDGSGNQIGVAPGARWIGCRNMEQGWGTPTTYLECFEFFLAPYPVEGSPGQGNPDLAPDVTTNSWSCPPEEGCAWDVLQAAVEAHRAAGILTVVSAGNDGYGGCSTVSKPPAIYDAAYTVGATDSGDYLAGYSSRGPVVMDGSNHLKPDIVAPGSSIRSSVPGGAFGSKSGTSMAAPHVAGAAALLWSAVPALVHDLEATEAQLNDHAYAIASSDCFSAGVPNNLYGWGRLDVHAAVLPFSGVLTGLVTEASDSAFPGAAVGGVRLEASSSPAVRAYWFGDGIGVYGARLISSTYTLTVSAAGYQTSTVPGVVVQEALTTTVDITLTCSIWGSLVYQPVVPLAGQQVALTSTVIAGVPPISYTWDLGDEGELQVGSSVTHTFTAAGVFTVTLTMDNLCPGSTEVQRPIVVREIIPLYLPMVMRSVGS
jgi:serine protease AprX